MGAAPPTSGTIAQAAAAIHAGLASIVVCYRSFRIRSGVRLGYGMSNFAASPTSELSEYSWSTPFGLMTPAQQIAMFATRYMHKFGATSEDFGRVAVAARRHAANNPHAYFYQRPITLEEHQQSRWIVEPLHLLDCCQENDGAQAIIVTSAERARDLAQPAAIVEAAVQGIGPGQRQLLSYYHDDITQLPELDVVAEQLWATSGLTPAHIQTAILYENFSPFVLFQLESYGFCGHGEAKDFVKDGNIEIGGGLPINTNGGQLGEAYIQGMNGIAEGVRQIRGTSVNQVAGAEHVIVTAGPGVPSSAIILGQPA